MPSPFVSVIIIVVFVVVVVVVVFIVVIDNELFQWVTGYLEQSLVQIHQVAIGLPRTYWFLQ